MDDDNFAQYRDKIAASVTDAAIDEKVLGLNTAGKYEKDNATGMYGPKPYSGYTIITPPFLEESENIGTYVTLADMQQALLQLVNPDMCAPVPISSFHLTIADLISGNQYSERFQSVSNEVVLREHVLRVFYKAAALIPAHPPNLRIRGLSLFPTVVVALVSTEDEPGYDRLIKFRDLIYSDSGLQQIGIYKPSYNFTGHVTLAYIEKISGDESVKLSRALKLINRDFFRKTLPLKVKSAELRKFNDMLGYYRETDWAVFHFMN